MSHWQTAKLGLNCSMAVLKRAMLNIMPTWESRLQEDAAGKLSAKNYYGHGTKQGYKMVVKLGNGDIGFKQEADGSWTVDYEGMVLPSIMRRSGGVETPLQAEIAAMKAKARAQVMGYQVVSDQVIGDNRIIQTAIPRGDMPGGMMQA